MTARVIAAGAPGSLDEAVGALRRGEVIAIPTETVYGLAVIPEQASLERLLAAKHRSVEKGIQLLVNSVEQASVLAQLTPAAERLAATFWPGGLTLVMLQREGGALPELIGGGRPTIGVRLPDHDVPRALARLLGPLAASSANITGEPDATTPQRVLETLGDQVSLVLDDGPVRGGVPSTVVDCSDPSTPPRVLREGAISAEAIAAVLDEARPGPLG